MPSVLVIYPNVCSDIIAFQPLKYYFVANKKQLINCVVKISSLTTTVGKADAQGETQNICRPIRNSSGPKSGNCMPQLLFNVLFPLYKPGLKNLGSNSSFVPTTGVTNRTTIIPKAVSL